MTTTIVDELMGLVDQYDSEHWIAHSAKQRLRAALESRLRELLEGEAVKLPERDPAGSGESDGGAGMPSADNYFAAGYNACLDELAKLGPLYRSPQPAISNVEPAAWRINYPPSMPMLHMLTLPEFVVSEKRARDIEKGVIENYDGPVTVTPLYPAPRPFDAASISDERIDAAVSEWFASDANQVYGPVFTPELKDAAFRNRMRAAIATLVQP